MIENDKVKLKAFEVEFLSIIENWRRWGMLRDWLPPSWGNILGARYLRKNRSLDMEDQKEPIDHQSAIRMERIVVKLPKQYREAFVLHYVGCAVVNGRMKKARTRSECAKVIGIGKTQYYDRLGKAVSIVAREWMYGIKNEK